MTDKIAQLVKENLNIKGEVLISKFHHGNPPKPESKVLFLATNNSKPLCLVKIVRDKSANEKIKHEKEFQEKFSMAPRVYFDAVVSGQYLYAEEIILGKPLSEKAAFEKEKEIVEIVKSFPTYDEVLTSEIYKIFAKHINIKDVEAMALMEVLNKPGFEVKKGFSHGDLTRKNVLVCGNKLFFIDWERAEERPFWLVDVAHYMAKLRNNIESLERWREEASELFREYTGVDEATANAIFCIEMILEIFCKKYPEKYRVVIRELLKI